MLEFGPDQGGGLLDLRGPGEDPVVIDGRIAEPGIFQIELFRLGDNAHEKPGNGAGPVQRRYALGGEFLLAVVPLLGRVETIRGICSHEAIGYGRFVAALWQKLCRRGSKVLVLSGAFPSKTGPRPG